METSLDRPSSSSFILPSFLSPELCPPRPRQATRRLFFYLYLVPGVLFFSKGAFWAVPFLQEIA